MPGSRSCGTPVPFASTLLLFCLAGGLLLPATPAACQGPESGFSGPRWTGDLLFGGTNALAGGLTAGLLQRLEGGSFSDGFTRGALGGAVAYGGRRIAADHYFGAGLLGRQVSAMGISAIRNASRGDPILETLVFPVGPLRVYVDRSDGRTVRPKLVVADAVATLSVALHSETRMDWSSSVSAGAPVFRTPGRARVDDEGRTVDGGQLLGTIILSDIPPVQVRRTLAHERVHVLQNDLQSLAWSGPIEGWLLNRYSMPRRLHRHLDPGFAWIPVRGSFNALFGIRHEDTLAEMEARFLDRRPPRE